MQFTSGIVEQAVEALSSFPGIGKRTALRLVMYLLKRPEMEVANLADALLKLKTELHLCEVCGNVSDHKRCDVCNNSRRSEGVICVVEDFSDLMAIESTAQFKGKYHVLGGAISPIDGIGPENLRIKELMSRLAATEISEIIIATDPNLEGEATATYLTRLIKPLGVKVSRLASGLPVGGDLEYADEITLGRAFEGRRSYDS
jgi:recombination protein RecR